MFLSNLPKDLADLIRQVNKLGGGKGLAIDIAFLVNNLVESSRSKDTLIETRNYFEKNSRDIEKVFEKFVDQMICVWWRSYYRIN